MLKFILLSLSVAPLLNSPYLWSFALVIIAFFSILFTPVLYSQHLFNLVSPLFFIDNLRAPLILLTSWISLLIILARFKIKITSLAPKTFITLIFSLALILFLTFSAHNTLIFYIIFEASLIPTLLIILGWGYQPERIQASIYLMLYTVLASLPLLVILLFLSSSSFSAFFRFQYSSPLPLPLTSSIWLISIIAFLVKIPLFLVHLWLPKAHVEAPVAGSIILAAILLKLGSYGILRLLMLTNPPNNLISPPLIAIALWGATVTRFICTRQPDIKSLIAYSSVSHIGLLTAGLITETLWAWQGSLTIIIAHGLSSSGLFALANISYESSSTRRILLSKGIVSLAPTFSILAFFLIIANMAAPPTLNLLRELLLITSIISFSKISLILISPPTFLAAAYSLILFTLPHYGPPSPLSNPALFYSPRNALTLLLHIIPLFFLFLAPDNLSLWF